MKLKDTVTGIVYEGEIASMESTIYQPVEETSSGTRVISSGFVREITINFTGSSILGTDETFENPGIIKISEDFYLCNYDCLIFSNAIFREMGVFHMEISVGNGGKFFKTYEDAASFIGVKALTGDSSL